MHESGQTYGNISQGLTDLVNEANRWVYRMFRSNFRWLIFALTKKDDIKSDQNAFQLYTNSYTKVIDNKWLVTENAIHKVNGFSGEKMVGPNKPVGTASPLDPANDGAEIVNGVAERVRRELLRNMNLSDL